MIKRGLKEPKPACGRQVLTVIDSCPGLGRAVEELLPNSDIQRCTKHRIENVLDKVVEADKASVKESVRKVFYATTVLGVKEA